MIDCLEELMKQGLNYQEMENYLQKEERRIKERIEEVHFLREEKEVLTEKEMEMIERVEVDQINLECILRNKARLKRELDPMAREPQDRKVDSMILA